MSIQLLGQVLANDNIAPGHYLMEVEFPEIAALAKPGQFVHLRVGDTSDPLLRRPISLYSIDPEKGTISLLYQVVGRGTTIMSRWEKGQQVDVMGPLGQGFSMPPQGDNITVIGGGIGVAPLFPLLDQLQKQSKKVKVIFGARTREALLGLDKIKAMGLEIHIATDDGSAGHHGFVTDIFTEENKKLNPDFIYACGPEPMLAAVTAIALAAGIPGQISLEERMGCGVGACLACVCKTKDRSGEGFTHQKVCHEGPVFDLQEVVFGG